MLGRNTMKSMGSIFQRYLDNHSQINLIALQTGIIGGILAIFYARYNPSNQIIVIITGLLLNGMMLSTTYRAHNSIQRLRYGLICALGSGLAFGIGSFVWRARRPSGRPPCPRPNRLRGCSLPMPPLRSWRAISPRGSNRRRSG